MSKRGSKKQQTTKKYNKYYKNYKKDNRNYKQVFKNGCGSILDIIFDIILFFLIFLKNSGGGLAVQSFDPYDGLYSLF